MSRSAVSKLELIIYWHVKNNLLHPIVLINLALALFIYFVTIQALRQVEDIASFFETILFPLYVISSASLQARRSRDLVFEVSIFRSYVLTYLCKILVFVFSLTMLIAGVSLIDIICRMKYSTAEALIYKLIIFVTIISCCINIRNPNTYRTILFIVFFVTPFITRIMYPATRTLWYTGERDKLIILYFFTTITTEYELYAIAKVDPGAGKTLYQLRILVVLTALIVMFISTFIFKKREYRIY